MNGIAETGVYRRAADGGLPDPSEPAATDLARARKTVSAAHGPTPLILSPTLSQRVGKEVHLKLEGTSAVRSFKFRGALVAVAQAVEESPGRPIVTASTGNHGQGVAFAGKRLGVEIIVCSPTTTLYEKRAAMESLGAEVVVTGPTLTESEHRAREIASERGGLYIEDGESPHLMAGAATVVLEMLEQQPDLDTIIVPIGGGNLVAASLLAAVTAGSSARVVGVQSVAAPGATFSWLAGEIVRHGCDTYAGGLATERPGELSLSVMTRLLETIVLVAEDDLRAESGWAYQSLGLVVEGAAAAPLAAIRHHPEIAGGDSVGIVLSGSWLSADQLAEGLDLVSHLEKS
ncbi:MAG: pyridoxal-phosphate dependent enzyme [Acidimicrobiia bacterium]|nr:pyridoxal-phosphate dependent enzyme [Acidimicrobiia bacterium]NNF63248.1 pyridoxal-phosphate dependent enzyme [Acidimicrobiia bacterium]